MTCLFAVHRSGRKIALLVCLGVAGLVWGTERAAPARAQEPVVPAAELPRTPSPPVSEVIGNYCLDCHTGEDAEGALDLESVVDHPLEQHSVVWERVIRKLKSHQMPPAGEFGPQPHERQATITKLVKALDAEAAEHPHPGRTDTFRRLNRFEYQNAIRDLLALDIDAAALLPADESSHGFDNVTVGDLPPTLLTRYINAAQKISRLAVGAPRKRLEGHTIRIAPDVTQEQHVPGLPLGTRGGTVIGYTFPRTGEYEVQVNLARDRNEHVEGLRQPHEMEILVDRRPVASFPVIPPKQRNKYFFDDSQLTARIHVTAGRHDLGVTFIKNQSSLQETKRQPLNVHFNYTRHPRLTPAVYQVSITGPYYADTANAADVPAEQPPRETRSRQRIFTCYPAHVDEEDDCARQIISRLARQAYRRPVNEEDLQRPLEFYHQARAEHGFEAGIETALSSILVSPRFLFRIERDPEGAEPGSVYAISDRELASRLSFFLWSSLPDDALLTAAERGELRNPELLKRQVDRMLADPRSESLATNFAAQWLYLRNLDSKTPDGRIYPDFDDNLRQAFRRETELLFQSVVREDRSVLDLVKSDYTYLNERLAKHYGIPHIYGSRFRRVLLPESSKRGGLMRHGSILTVTSYATRTSPVIRGNWILENLLATPTPPPPPNVPSLDEVVIGKELSIRERLAAHRANPSCASCHEIMDPIGFALENYDAVGRWRDDDFGRPVEADGRFTDGSRIDGVFGLEAEILNRPEMFVGAMTEKLLTYALGRGIEDQDAPAVRGIVRQAAAADYRFSAVIWGIVNSPPFQMRTSE